MDFLAYKKAKDYTDERLAGFEGGGSGGDIEERVDNIEGELGINQGNVTYENFDSGEPLLPFTGNWYTTIARSYEGSHSLTNVQSDNVSNAYLTLTFSEEGKIVFWFRTSTRWNYYEYMRFFIDGTEVLRTDDGNYPWTRFEHIVGSGEHTFRWWYDRHNIYGSEGEGHVYIDSLEFHGVGSLSLKDKTNTHISNTDNPHAVTSEQVGAIPVSEKGVVDGVATLGSDGLVPTNQLPESSSDDTTLQGKDVPVPSVDNTILVYDTSTDSYVWEEKPSGGGDTSQLESDVRDIEGELGIKQELVTHDDFNGESLLELTGGVTYGNYGLENDGGVRVDYASNGYLNITLSDAGSITILMSFVYGYHSDDAGYFYIDGVEKLSYSGTNTGFIEHTFPLSSGSHELRWETDPSSSSSYDVNWLIDSITVYGMGLGVSLKNRVGQLETKISDLESRIEALESGS